MAKTYYVYELWFEASTNPFYVGKTYHGSRRLSGHISSSTDIKAKGYNTLKSISIRKHHISEGKNILEKVVFESANEVECMGHEHSLIVEYGRRDLGTGILTNQTFGWEGAGGKLMPDDVRDRIILEGRMLRPPSNQRIPISIYTENGVYIETLQSGSSACEKYGFYSANIPKTIRGDSGRRYMRDRNGVKYRASYYKVDQLDPFADIIVTKRISSGVKQPVIQLTLEGVFVARFESSTAAARAIGTGKAAIGNCISGRTRSSMGFLWKYENT